jgi:hypothetical protein
MDAPREKAVLRILSKSIVLPFYVVRRHGYSFGDGRVLLDQIYIRIRCIQNKCMVEILAE